MGLIENLFNLRHVLEERERLRAEDKLANKEVNAENNTDTQRSRMKRVAGAVIALTFVGATIALTDADDRILDGIGEAREQIKEYWDDEMSQGDNTEE